MTVAHAELTYAWVRHYDHHICVGGEDIDVGCKLRVANLHALELRGQLAAAQLELFDDVGYLLKAVNIPVRSSLTV